MPGRTLTSSERDWLAVRAYLTEHRHDLAVDAAREYPPGAAVAGTPLLAAPAWRPPAPVPLRDIGLELTAPVPPDGALPDGAPPPTLLPRRADGTRYRRYSEAMAELAAPRVFANRATYRLTEADLTSRPPRLAFTVGRYFDGIDGGEAAAHEYAAARLGLPAGGLRGRLADPCDLRRRRANVAISVLTLRLDAASGRASFPLHWRDPAKVGHAGGLYQVVPVGVFQPSGEAARSDGPDFSLWRCVVREFAEELAGYPEDEGPVDYDSWPFARQLTGALDRGQVRVWCLGLGVDPLTYATDLLTAAVFDAGVFDGLFGGGFSGGGLSRGGLSGGLSGGGLSGGGLSGGGSRRNAEGEVLAAREFTADVIDGTIARDPVQAAGAALLRLAWEHRDTLLG
jgi:hypothetical protein